MIIENIKIENYKCFYETTEIPLEQGFNLFIGKNNSGKTTALELLNALGALSENHKSILSIKNFGESTISPPKHSITISLTIDELRRVFGETITIPLPKNIAENKNIANIQDEIGKQILAENKIIIEYTFESNKILVSTITAHGDSGQLEEGVTHPGIKIDFSRDERPPIFYAANFGGIISATLKHATLFKKFIYRFSALRTPQSQHGMAQSTILNPDAANLAYCINHLQTNDSEGHKQLCALINRVFPEIKWIQSPPSTATMQFELRCLPLPPEDRRDDLAIPLNKMGTGIGNVISILYVILTSRFPQVIAIDEPNSFLHPKALRELLQILESHGKEHQYILTGHSPEVLTAIEPSTITYFEIENSSSKVKQFTKGQFHELRSGLSDLGIRMTDLHARDQVLWVEGQTEELIFPSLLRAFCPLKAAGTAVLRVTNTGRFEQKGLPINEVADAYQRLTNDAIVPPLVTILLDKEGKTDAQVQELMSKSKILKILPLRMIENYVLDTDAIHHVMQKHGSTLSKELISSEIPSSLDLKTFDGAKLLKTIFADSKPVTINYSKTTHTVEIFEWLLENKPHALAPLKEFIENMMRD